MDTTVDRAHIERRAIRTRHQAGGVEILQAGGDVAPGAADLALSLMQLGIARPVREALSPPGAELGAARLAPGQPTGGAFLEPGWGRKDSEAP
ncbi:hypothetical protein [Streptomyces sp. NPDC047009]|uniref:hypothetical protein n=1 Tax=unclassified Streptomyces TaxID=2593676 RepID=UPI0033FC7FC6